MNRSNPPWCRPPHQPFWGASMLGFALNYTLWRDKLAVYAAEPNVSARSARAAVLPGVLLAVGAGLLGQSSLHGFRKL